MKKLFNFLLLPAFWVCSLIYLTNCQSKIEPVETNGADGVISETARELFARKEYTSFLKEKIGDSLEISWTPLWDNFTESIEGDSIRFSYVPLLPELRNVSTGKVETKAKFAGFVKYIILKSTAKHQHTFYLGKYTSSLSDGAIDLNNFTGSLLLTNMENRENSYLTFDKGKKEANARILDKLSSNNLKANGCLVLVTCSWGNWNCGNVYLTSTTSQISCSYPLWKPCELAQWELNGQETSWNCTPDDPNFPYIPSTPINVVKDVNLLSKYSFAGPDTKISNIKNYLKCFSLSSTAFRRTVTLYVDQPVENSILAINPLAQGGHTVGHAFVELTKENYQSPRSPNPLPIVRRTVGFYPTGNATPFNPKSPGALGDDSGYTGTLNVVATFTATEAEFSEVLKIVEAYSTAEYNINTKNCSNFTSDILSKLGVNIPTSWQQSFWFNMSPTGSAATNIKGASVGAYGELIKNLSHPKLSDKSVSNVSTKENTGTCN